MALQGQTRPGLQLETARQPCKNITAHDLDRRCELRNRRWGRRRRIVGMGRSRKSGERGTETLRGHCQVLHQQEEASQWRNQQARR